MLRTRCIVAGTRTFNDLELLKRNLVHIFMSKGLRPQDVEIISGGARGADDLAIDFYHFVREKGLDIKLKIMEADWDRRGDSAGYIRNLEMALYAKSNPDPICVCFWDGVSDGTRHMMKIAEKEGLELHVIKY